MAGTSLDLRLLPNYPALILLNQQYYAKAGGDALSSSTHLSSHWRAYTQGSQVEIDNEGCLVNLRGEGFGSYRDERWLKRLADYICCTIHFLQGEYKREVICLTKFALSLIKKIPFGNHYFSYDLFRQICAFAVVMQYFHPHGRKRFTILVIGDGYGFLAALVKSVYPDALVVLVDIGRTLLFQCFYLQVMYPKHIHIVLGCHGEDRSQPLDADFLYCPTDKLEDLQDYRHCLAINVCSMQEMNKAEIERHFQHLRAQAEAGALFYCCNRESKVLPDGERVDFESYPWLPTDRHLIDGYPSVYRFWFSMRSKRNAPKWLGIRLPFVDGPDGPIRHRLTVLGGARETCVLGRPTEGELYGHPG